MHSVMVAIDGSDAANRALDTAVEFVQAVGAALTIVTVESVRYAKEQGTFEQVEGDGADLVEMSARQILGGAARQANAAGINPKLELLWGDPAEAIIGAAGRDKVDIIVAGRRGRGRLLGLLLGSVSQKLISLAPCTVIVVP